MKIPAIFRRRPRLLASREAYARWSANYPPIAHNPFMEVEQAAMLELLPDLHHQRVLDLACGSGRWGKIALERGAAQVISLDDSPPMLKAGQPSLPAIAHMAGLPLPDACVDAIICGLAIGHLRKVHLGVALGEMRRVLAPHGWALISDVHPTQMWHGGQRTFGAGKHTFAVEHTVHSYADYHTICRQIGLVIDEVREVSLKEGQPPVLLLLRLSLP